MSTSCEKTFTITVQEGDMPLNSAVYVGSRDKIYAVSMGHVFKFNASTGARESSSRYHSYPMCDDVYCAYDSTTDAIWATAWRYPIIDSETGTNPGRRLYKISPDTLSVITFREIGFDLGISSFEISHGPRQIVTDSGFGFLLICYASFSYIYKYNLSTLAAPVANVNAIGNAAWGNIDLANGLIFTCDSRQDTYVESFSLGLVGGTNSGDPFNPANPRPFGSCYSPVNNKIYYCSRSQYVRKANYLATGGSTIDLARPNANPMNIRFNAQDNLIYIPLYADNSIAVLNPADDSFTLKTGFDSPWDCVFTPTKKWALQHSSRGLQEIV